MENKKPRGRTGRSRLDHETVDADYSKEGFTLLSRYQNARAKNRVLCPEGHEFLNSRMDWTVGSRCPVCSAKKRALSRTLTQEEVTDRAYEFGYRPMETYLNSSQKMDWYDLKKKKIVRKAWKNILCECRGFLG